jgi:DNA polymerase-4
LRQAGVAGSTVRLKLRWSDFTTLTRQTQLPQATDQEKEICQAAERLLAATWSAGRPVRLIGVAVSGLGAPMRQLNLFDRGWEEDARLMQAVDAIRERFGQQALQRAATLKANRRRGERGGGER